MRREGCIHGTNVRVNKKEVGPSERAFGKPDNHSKLSARCPANVVRCAGCSHGLPVKKAISKCKTALKARDLDVTKNHKMADFSFSQKHRWGTIGGDVSDDEHECDSDEAGGYRADDQPSRSPVIECPIELLVQSRKRKAVRAPLVPEVLPMPISMTESVDSESDSECWSIFDEVTELSDSESLVDVPHAEWNEDLHLEVESGMITEWEIITDWQ